MSGPTTQSYESRLAELGIVLPQAIDPIGTYVPAVLCGSLLFVSGHGPRGEDASFLSGKVGRDVVVDEARRRARLVGIRLLGTVRRTLGSLDRLRRVGTGSLPRSLTVEIEAIFEVNAA